MSPPGPPGPPGPPDPGRQRGGTVFWKVAAVLVGAQVATALLAVALSGVFASDRSQELLAGTLSLRLDALAEEIESRAEIGPFGDIELGDRLRADLGSRFPDPLAFLDAEGAPVDSFGGSVGAVPAAAVEALAEGRVLVDLDGAGWGLAPILAPDGLPAGGVLVRPLAETVRQEQRGTRRAFWLSTALTVAVAVALALLLGALFTSRLVRPIREVTQGVERLGQGSYAGRLPDAGDDELSRLAHAVNEMAARVEASVESLRATDRLRRELVANVGHDLRTPLAALSATLDEAERHHGQGRAADLAADLDAARRQVAGAAALVADLFELSVLDHPDRTLRLGPVPVGEWVRDVAGRHAAAFERAGLALDVDVPAGLPTVHADGGRLVRALSNLLDNARDHTEPGGTVRLAARADRQSVEVIVEDTGVGIPADALDSVFERYYRGQGARTRGAGTGLGLAIARAVAQAHGGTLAVESQPGQGSRFALALPLAPPDAPPEPEGRPLALSADDSHGGHVAADLDPEQVDPRGEAGS